MRRWARVPGILGWTLPPPEAPPRENQVRATRRRRGRLPAQRHVIRIEPVIGIEKRHRVIALDTGRQRPNAACEIAVIAMRAVEPQMADAGTVDPINRKSIGHHEVIARQGLRLHAADAAFQKPAIFLVIGRYYAELHRLAPGTDPAA